MAGYGQGAAEGLEQVLARLFLQQKLREDMRQADMQHAVQQRQLGQGDRRIDLDGQRLGEDARQFDVSAGQRDRTIKLDEEAQPVRLKHMTAQTADIERKPLAEQEGRAHDQFMAGLQGKIRSGHIAQQGDQDVRAIGARGAQDRQTDAVRLASAKGANTPQAAADYSGERSTRVRDSVKELKGLVGPFTTGAGSVLANVPATSARTFKAKLDTLKANIAFGELTEMRAASKTGGALGAISDRELTLLSSSLGALDQGLSGEALAAELDKIDQSLTRWEQAKAAAQGGGAPAPANGPSDAPVRRYVPGKGWQ